jgi:hypothetical protein
MDEMLSPIMAPLVGGAEQTFAQTTPGYVPGTLTQNIAANTPPPPASSRPCTSFGTSGELEKWNLPPPISCVTA